MALKLDDLLVKKKEPVQILDLSNSTANSKEELKKLLERIPEFKIKIEKVKSEDVKIYDKKLSFRTPKKDLKRKGFPFANPVPSEMQSLHLDDLCSISIQWKMLTSLKPKTKLDEEYFSKLIELGKLQQSTSEKGKKSLLKSYFKKSKNRAGVLETRIVFCPYCNEDFCLSETCRQFSFECYERMNVNTIAQFSIDNNSTKTRNKRKQGRRKKNKTILKVDRNVHALRNENKLRTVLGSKIQKSRVNEQSQKRQNLFTKKETCTLKKIEKRSNNEQEKELVLKKKNALNNNRRKSRNNIKIKI